MAKHSKKNHSLHPDVGHDVLISLLKEKAKEAEKERIHMRNVEAEAYERVEKEKERLIEVLEKEIERNEKQSQLAKAKIQQAERASAIYKRKAELKLQNLIRGLDA